MKIIHRNNWKSDKYTCVALGNFDGVHTGHQSIINSCIEYARKNGFLSCVYTFHTHTSAFLGNKKPLLTTEAERNNKIGELGCDYICEDDFLNVKDMTAESFCKYILRDALSAKAVFCGANYRFGKDGLGDTDFLLAELCKYGIKVFVLPYTYCKGTVVSSTEIRNALAGGNPGYAAEMLGRPYSVTGTVLHGKKLGRLLGFPTLNIEIPKGKIVPAFGVYTAICELDGKKYRAVTNIGVRPTTDSNTPSENYVNCETHLMSYSGNSYGKVITVSLVSMLRGEKKFRDAEELKAQIMIDSAEASAYFDKYDMELI